MCQQTYRTALAQLGTEECARRLLAACGHVSVELAPMTNGYPIDHAALAEAIGEALCAIDLLTPVIGPGLIELAKVDHLASLQLKLHTTQETA